MASPALSMSFSRSSTSELILQPLYGAGLAPDAQVCALAVGAFLEHLARCEDLAAHVLRGPGEEELRLDKAALEEPGDSLVQLCHVALAAGAHHDASRIFGAQCRLIAAAIDFVEDEKARHALRADFVEDLFRDLELALESRIAGAHDMAQQGRLERLVERRLERSDEPVRQVLDEADGVA